MRFDPLAHPEPLIRRVYAYAAYRLGDGPDAEDATSDTFERALRYRDRYDRKKGEPIAWLLGIARRCVDDVFQGRSPIVEPDEETRSPEDLEPEAIQRITVRQALGSLDDRARELIALRYGADLTARQIAEVLGERTNAVEVALHRTLGRLERVLADERPAPGRTPAAGGEEVIQV
jgi:RNA polymerase sigma-70 factor (ECF subfamily)